MPMYYYESDKCFNDFGPGDLINNLIDWLNNFGHISILELRTASPDGSMFASREGRTTNVVGLKWG